MDILKDKTYKCGVSSVLNKDIKSYGKKFLFDDSEETCWNSDSGTPQWILITIDEPCTLSTISIEFQGGFAGKDCHLEAGTDSKNMKKIQDFYPNDINTIQEFKLDKPIEGSIFKIVFNSSTDLFGRIIIYKLSMYS
ncbi:hypothetical protein HCN44_008247 [Aphidius gifuensis]|uniref:Nuclear receptor 2C2-associated protein n=1 Tax=Aphidius gifuensis TaxID=684658 RepID=A0A834XNB8_APHGI|nr:nuclear receptor 2C2-associated protein [Aphidius gifuensis]KAF7989573.1 hypothetical protein HCN44_008247 [Aphidius gifuensis]